MTVHAKMAIANARNTTVPLKALSDYRFKRFITLKTGYFQLNVLYKSDFAFIPQEKHIEIIRIITLLNLEKRQYLPHY